MHYIQNSWFTHNWIWVFTFIILFVAIAAYINNRKGLLKKAVAALGLFFVLSVCSSAVYFNQGKTLLTPGLTMENNPGKQTEVDHGSFFGTFSKAILKILSDKVSE